MPLTESTEMYLETILVLTNEKGNVRSIDVANRMNFSKPSISEKMKSFRQEGLITMDESGYISLTDKGCAIAERVFERHVVLSEILMSLGVDRETAVSDACLIEHDISDTSFNILKAHYKRQMKQAGRQ